MKNIISKVISAIFLIMLMIAFVGCGVQNDDVKEKAEVNEYYIDEGGTIHTESGEIDILECDIVYSIYAEEYVLAIEYEFVNKAAVPLCSQNDWVLNIQLVQENEIGFENLMPTISPEEEKWLELEQNSSNIEVKPGNKIIAAEFYKLDNLDYDVSIVLLNENLEESGMKTIDISSMSY